MGKKEIIIFTDGASKGNPGLGGWGAIVAHHELRIKNNKITELGGSEENTTNNRMEITAAIRALEFLSTTCPPLSDRPKIQSGDGRRENHKLATVSIYSDSSYLVNGITKWVHGWQKNNWRTSAKEDVLNKDLWQKLFEIVSKFSKISWHIVSGHVGLSGNERADVIADSFAMGRNIKLYAGSAIKYPIDLKNFSYSELKQEKKTSRRTRSGKQAYSYISLVGGVIKIDKIWADCEKRVKGKSGAKYKKAFSPEDERQIITEFKLLAEK